MKLHIVVPNPPPLVEIVHVIESEPVGESVQLLLGDIVLGLVHHPLWFPILLQNILQSPQLHQYPLVDLLDLVINALTLFDLPLLDLSLDDVPQYINQLFLPSTHLLLVLHDCVPEKFQGLQTRTDILNLPPLFTICCQLSPHGFNHPFHSLLPGRGVGGLYHPSIVPETPRVHNQEPCHPQQFIIKVNNDP